MSIFSQINNRAKLMRKTNYIDPGNIKERARNEDADTYLYMPCIWLEIRIIIIISYPSIYLLK